MAVVESDPHIKSLKAVSTAAMIYRRLPNTTIEIRVLQRQLWQAQWVPKLPLPTPISLTKGLAILGLQPYVLSRSESFACITMFESGQYDLNPDDLKNVMAMSSGDSLYISATLLQDPFEPDSGLIRRVIGNIGQPGIVFLVSPLVPLIKSPSISEWPQIDRAIFDGEFRDCFASTSLHLSFTGANDSLNVEFTGAQDTEVYILETLISVYDRGKWIADIDPSRAGLCLNLRRLPPCRGDNQCNTRTQRSHTICIDNWLELIDASEEDVSLVRAHKNWQARLAATLISIQKGYNTVVLSDKMRKGETEGGEEDEDEHDEDEHDEDEHDEDEHDEDEHDKDEHDEDEKENKEKIMKGNKKKNKKNNQDNRSNHENENE